MGEGMNEEREEVYCLSCLENFPIFLTAFYLLFRGSFWGPFGDQNGSCMVPLERLRSLLSKDIKFTQIGARTEKLWLPEVGVSEQFFCIFPAKIPTKPEMLPANRELYVAAEVALFLKVPDLRINSQRVGKTLCAKTVSRVEKRVGFPAQFSYFHRFSRARLT
jgi:hypothetical protein